jgi:hypothetical protein
MRGGDDNQISGKVAGSSPAGANHVSIYQIFPAVVCPGVESASKKIEDQ